MVTTGTRLGPYEIVSSLGSGGMGEVYRARDLKLGREVALKILPETFAADAERLARFQREAQVLASLNHPNIGAIYGLEDTSDIRALALELVDGPTLAERIARGPLPLDEVLPIARQIAEALEAAHDQGIIHRDLKPANIKLRSDGTVKVLDFGLAKLIEPGLANRESGPVGHGLSQSPTITTPAMTLAGVILGTAAYMSPEQAKGRTADKRSDLWAFGCVLFEMLTGKRPFEGEDVSDTLAAVLRGDPDWNVLPAEVPAIVRTALQQCLEKDRRRRVSDASTIRVLLSETTIASVAGDLGVPRVAPRPLWARAAPFALVALAAIAVSSVAWWLMRPQPVYPAVVRFTYSLPDDQRFSLPFLMEVALSRDGTQIAYVASNRIYLRSISESAAHPIAGTEEIAGGNVGEPVFSPDGRSIAFWTRSSQVPSAAPGLGGMLKRIATTGGTAVTLAQVDFPFGIVWDGDTILVGQRGGIVRVPSDGGKPERIVQLKDTEAALRPQLLPGNTVLFTLGTDVQPTLVGSIGIWDKATIVAQSLTSSERVTLAREATDGRYLPTGHLLYAQGGVVFSQRFDATRLQVTGRRVPVIEGVARAGVDLQNQTGSVQVSISDTGSLIYVPGPADLTTRTRDLVLFDRTGSVESLKAPRGMYEYPRVSPNGKQVAVGTDDGKEAHVWISDVSGATSMRRLTFQGRNRFPIWSADGQRVTYQSDHDGEVTLMWQRADGSMPPERLMKAEPNTSPVPEAWSPDGKHLLFTTGQAGTGSLWVLSMQDGTARRFGDVTSNTGIAAISPTFSPDGRWVAYVASTAATRASTQIFVQPFPPTGIRYSVVTGGTDPTWSRTGRELVFYNLLNGQGTAAVITTQPTFTVGSVTTLPSGGLFPRRLGTNRDFDMFPDGNRFVAAVASGGRPRDIRQFEVVLNWFEELKQRVAAN